jgi:hypothetical protein
MELEDVFCISHRGGEKGGGQEVRGTQVQRRYITVFTFILKLPKFISQGQRRLAARSSRDFEGPPRSKVI